jgi:hypothetical protein
MRFQAVVSLFVPLSCGGGASADCPEARDHYLAVVEEIREYLGRYVQCITSSHGLEDCSSEFRRLGNAQSESRNTPKQFRGRAVEAPPLSGAGVRPQLFGGLAQDRSWATELMISP